MEQNVVSRPPPPKSANQGAPPGIFDIPAPSKKAPTRTPSPTTTNARADLDKSRNEFVTALKKNEDTFGEYEKFATTIAFQERRVKGSKAQPSDKAEFQKHVNENRRIMFNRLSEDTKGLLLQSARGSWSDTIRACKGILSGIPTTIRASGLSEESQAGISSKIESAIVTTLVIKFKQGMQTNKTKSELSDMKQEIKALPISDEAKASAMAQIERLS